MIGFRLVSSVVGLTLITAACQSKPRSVVGSDSVRDSAASVASRDSSTTRRKIVFAGTSLTAGYGLDPDSAYSYMIQRKIDSAGLPFEAVNAGVSGETTSGLLQRLDWLLKGNFDVLVIESGANDGLRGVNADAIEKNLAEIVRQVQTTRPDALLLLVQMEALPNYGRQYGTGFHDVYVRVARQAKIGLLPFLLNGVAGHAELNQNDGIHPNLLGEHIVADNMWRALEPLLRNRGAGGGRREPGSGNRGAGSGNRRLDNCLSLTVPASRFPLLTAVGSPLNFNGCLSLHA